MNHSCRLLDFQYFQYGGRKLSIPGLSRNLFQARGARIEFRDWTVTFWMVSFTASVILTNLSEHYLIPQDWLFEGRTSYTRDHTRSQAHLRKLEDIENVVEACIFYKIISCYNSTQIRKIKMLCC